MRVFARWLSSSSYKENLIEKKMQAQLSELQAGDIILFSGKYILSKLIIAASNAPYSHIGIVVEINGNKCIFEARQKTGVKLLPLTSRLKHYKSERLVYRKLQCTPKERELIRLKLICFVKENQGKTYEKNLFMLCYALCIPSFNCCCRPKRPDDKFFCSELVARALQYCGVLNKSRKAYEYEPSAFSSGAETMELGIKVVLNKPYSFGPEIELDDFSFST